MMCHKTNAKMTTQVNSGARKDRWYRLELVYISFTGLSIILTLFPQTGYIHPDEFFQSVEVTAGDIFGYEVNRPWEFDSGFPIRSIVLPFLTTGPSYLILYVLSRVSWTAQFISVTPYTLLVLPRLTFAILGILCNIYLGRLARGLGFNRKVVMCAYASSYVALVFYTRTFSNTLESFMFIFLLYNVRRFLYARGTAGAFTVTVIIVAGVFNRPTFAFFAVVPYLYWLFSIDIQPRSARRIRTSAGVVARKLVVCCFYGTLTAAAFILCDTLYFRRRSLEQMVESLIFAKSFTAFLAKEFAVTPLNFMAYNVDPSNLSEHGLHPRITHVLVNIPLLFGPMAFYVCVELYVYIKRLITRTVLPPRQFLLLSFFVPLALLSVFPHQEPRFLLPLLAPLCVLYGYQVFGERSSDCVSSAWLVFTSLGLLFYGYLHQGGVIPAITQLSGHLGQHQPAPPADNVLAPTTHHVIFYHTYMPPQFLFQSRPGSRVAVTDLKGSSVETLSLFVRQLHAEDCNASGCAAFLVVPKSLGHVVARVTRDTLLPLVLYKSIFPHLSTEDPPQLTPLIQSSVRACADKYGENHILHFPCGTLAFIHNTLHALEIEIHEIVFPHSWRGPRLKGSFQS